jgi:hypothetical protein
MLVDPRTPFKLALLKAKIGSSCKQRIPERRDQFWAAKVRLGVKSERISVADRELYSLRSAPVDLERQVVLATGDRKFFCLSVSDLSGGLTVDDNLIGSQAVRIARISHNLQ